MKYKEFVAWCNKRACDGCWDIKTAILCVQIMNNINSFHFWDRGIAWKAIKNAVERTKTAVTQWLAHRLRLEVSEEKTRIINAKRRYSEFLGFKIKVHPKAGKQVVESHICDKRLQAEREKLIGQAKQIVCPRHGKTELDEIRIYNSMVMGIQEYYKIATAINLDCRFLNRAVMTVLTSRLKTQTGNRYIRSLHQQFSCT